MFQAVDRSLERLKTRHLDLLYVHFWDYVTPEVEIMRGLDDLVRSGKVHYLAISDSPGWEVARCNTIAEMRGWSPFIAYQGRHNIGDRSMEREIIPMCNRMGLGVIPWSVLGQVRAGGVLTPAM
jgi:aryl-alcohol dehydrogenase-like predicted oxidoreductase